MSESNGGGAESGKPVPLLGFEAQAGAPPLGAIFGVVGVVAGAGVWLLRLDRLPYVFCTFKLLTGLPCPTCGSTRVFGRLAALDLPGALWMNPLTGLAALLFVGWALADLVLLPSHRALRVTLHPALVTPVRVAAVVAFLVNWVFLLATGR